MKDKMLKVFEGGMQIIMSNAMKKTCGWGFCWYDDPLTNEIINYGVKRGWLCRCSITQVHWLDHLFEKDKYYRDVFKSNFLE